MSSSDGNSRGFERYPGTGCCGTSCTSEKSGCLALEPRIRSCFCQENVGCLDRTDCGGFRPTGTAATGACPGPCQCAEEEAWNLNVPPKPNCEWLANFSELRRQWSDHGRQNNCKCCNCKPCRKAAPCKPCLPLKSECSKSAVHQDNYQICASNRLYGGANGKESSCCRDRSPSPVMRTTFSSLGNRVNMASSQCCPPSNACSSLLSGTPSETDFSSISPGSCRPPSSCKPCSPSTRPTPNQRSCCECVPDYCMCQPMPRTCNCPPPISIDARAARECDCECPSSPECACPPSERKFGKSNVKCPNARLCCSTPRPQPGPKCNCTECQPCLPPPCDPCTSSKCRTVTPKFNLCRGDSVCKENSPCRLDTPKVVTCRLSPPCTECRKMALPGNSSSLMSSACREGFKRPHGRPRSPDCQCPATLMTAHNGSDKAHGEDNGNAESDLAQCHCGSSGSRGCESSYDYCCSLDCNKENETVTGVEQDQCDCDGGSKAKVDLTCHQDCQYCCWPSCNSQNSNTYNEDTKASERSTHVRKIRIAGTDEIESPNKKSHRYDKNNVGPFRKISSTSLAKNEMLPLKKQSNRAMETNWKNKSQILERPVLSAVADECSKSTCKLLRSLIPGRGWLPISSRSNLVSMETCRRTRCASGCTIANSKDEKSNIFRGINACLGNLTRMILIPGPLTFVSFVLLILIGLTGSFGLALHRRYRYAKKLCKRL